MLIDLWKEEIDVIHVHGYRAIHSEIAAWMRVFRGIPFVLSPHGSLLAYKYMNTSNLDRALHGFYDFATAKFVLRKATCVAVPSLREYSEVLDMGVPESRAKIMQHAEDIAFLNPARGQQKGDVKRVLFVGRISSGMNLHTLISAFSLVRKSLNNVELVLVGPGGGHKHIGEGVDLKLDLLDLCQNLGIEDSVKFTGPVYGAELGEYYQSADIFIYLCPYGNYGRTHIEAAAFGIPIISTSVGIAPDLVGNNEGGLLVAPYSIEEISEAMVSLLSDTNLYQEKRRAISERVKSFLNVKRMVDEYEQLYIDVVSPFRHERVAIRSLITDGVEV